MDWNEFGSDAFTVEVLGQIELSDEPDKDVSEDPIVLRLLWLNKLRKSGALFYGKSKISVQQNN
ncbi:MAG: hypothetical protein WB792_14955 [Desulfobacterales bacterium]